MPKINTKLASQSLSPQSTGSGALSPVLISSRSGQISTAGARVTAKVRAPSISADAGRIGYKPLKPNDIVVNPAINAAGQMAQAWAQAAFNFQERQDKADADALLNTFREELKKGEIGYVDDDGNKVDGYLYLEGRKATERYQDHRTKVDSLLNDLVQEASPNVRQLALIRLNKERGLAQDRAATHNATQFKEVEKQIRWESNQQALDLAKEYGPAYFVDGRMDSHLDEHYSDDPVARAAAAEFITKNTMYESFNAITREPGFDPMDAYQAAQDVYDAGKEHLSEEDQVTLDKWLVDKLHTAREKQRTQATGQMALARYKATEATPGYLNELAVAGNWEGFNFQFQQFRGMYADQTPLQQHKAQVGALTGTIEQYVNSGRFENILDKEQAAIELLNMMDENNDGSIPSDILAAVADYVTEEMPGKILSEQRSKDSLSTVGLAASFEQYRGQGVPPYQPPPQGMLPSKKIEWDNAQKKNAQQIINGLTPEEFEAHSNAKVLYEGEQIIRPLSPEQKEEAWQRVVNGDMSMHGYFAVMAKDKQLTAPDGKKPAYMEVPPYKSGVSRVEGIAKQGIFDLDMVEPKKDSPEYPYWVDQHRINTAAAAKSWDDYAAAEYERGNKNPDFQGWYSDYMLKLNKGQKISDRWLKQQAVAPVSGPEGYQTQLQNEEAERNAKLQRAKEEASKKRLEETRSRLQESWQGYQAPPAVRGNQDAEAFGKNIQKMQDEKERKRKERVAELKKRFGRE